MARIWRVSNVLGMGKKRETEKEPRTAYKEIFSSDRPFGEFEEERLLDIWRRGGTLPKYITHPHSGTIEDKCDTPSRPSLMLIPVLAPMEKTAMAGGRETQIGGPLRPHNLQV